MNLTKKQRYNKNYRATHLKELISYMKVYRSTETYKIRKNKLAMQDYYEKREYLNKLKYKPCMDCHKRYPSYVMDFDHRNPRFKQVKISQFPKYKWEQVLKEIKKCDVVCSNCHRIRTYLKEI